MKIPPPRKTTQSDYIKTALRLPSPLHANLALEAERNFRSLNAEIIYRLTEDPLEMLRKQNEEIIALLRSIRDRT